MPEAASSEEKQWSSCLRRKSCPPIGHACSKGAALAESPPPPPLSGSRSIRASLWKVAYEQAAVPGSSAQRIDLGLIWVVCELEGIASA